VTPTHWDAQGVWYLDIEVLNTPARQGTMGEILPNNWLPLAPDGSSFGAEPSVLLDRHTLLNQKFADAWRVKPNTSLFDYASGTSTATFTDVNWPPEPGKPCKATIGVVHPSKPLEPGIAVKQCDKLFGKDKLIAANCAVDLDATADFGVLKAYLLTLKLREQAAH
jgi:hypothetical protein